MPVRVFIVIAVCQWNDLFDMEMHRLCQSGIRRIAGRSIRSGLLLLGVAFCVRDGERAGPMQDGP